MGDSNADVSETWGDVKTIHFVYKDFCLQLNGKPIEEHTGMKKADHWGKKHGVEFKDGNCDKKHWDDKVKSFHKDGVHVKVFSHKE